MRGMLAAVVVCLAMIPAGDIADSGKQSGPAFSGQALVRPTDYATWPVVGTSLGLTYSDHPQSGPGAFHRVYMNPSAYDQFLRTRSFPDGTMFVLEEREARQKTSILRGGFFEGRRIALASSVKDRQRFRAGWAYFDFDNGARATATAFDDSECHSCHVAHGQQDSVFVQFYPALRGGD
jgi:hypothetical protein